jgi:hypothetical protein
MSNIISVRSIELNHGKSLLLAILLTSVGAVLIFILSRSFLIHQDFIDSIYENGIPRSLAGFFLIAFPYIHQHLAGRQRTSFSHLPDGAVPFEAYSLPWYILLTYGVLITFAIAGISLFLIWLLGLATAFFITRLISLMTWIILLISFYYLGFWAGTRNTDRPSLISIGIVLGYIILELLASFLVDIDSPLRNVFGLVIFLIPSLVAALTGARTGKHRRLSNYVHFLLTPLPEQEQQTIVDSVYREVKQRTSDKN